MKSGSGCTYWKEVYVDGSIRRQPRSVFFKKGRSRTELKFFLISEKGHSALSITVLSKLLHVAFWQLLAATRLLNSYCNNDDDEMRDRQSD